jgi:hypothetical protein
MADDVINLAKPQAGEQSKTLGVDRTDKVGLEGDRTDPYSLIWSKVVWPITRSLLLLLAVVMLVPFVFVLWLTPTQVKVTVPKGTSDQQVAAIVQAVAQDRATKRLEMVLDWAKTILPSAVGFGSAMVGYYFGTRAAQPNPTGQPAAPQPVPPQPVPPKPPAQPDDPPEPPQP